MKLKTKAIAFISITAIIVGAAITFNEASRLGFTQIATPSSNDGPKKPEAAKETPIPVPDETLLREINEVVGVRDLLTEKRKGAAVKEWLAGEDDLSDLDDNPPQTLPEVLIQVEKMYQGETKFTEKRVMKLVAITEKNPTLRAQYSKYIFPFPSGFLEADPIDEKIRDVKRKYEAFHQYIDRMVAPIVNE